MTMQHFSEIQRFRQWWIWLIIILSTAVFIFSIFHEFRSNSSGTFNESTAGAIIGLAGLVIAITLILIIKLETMIQPDGIFYRFYPIHKKFRKIAWSDLQYTYIRKYNPFLEYGGWGIRFIGLFGKGKALNISGNTGLQLVFTNGKRLLIGTRKPDEIEKILKDFKKWNMENV